MGSDRDITSRLLDFLEKLSGAKIQYQLIHYRDNAISVLVFVPGQHWEVDFLDDGEVEIEIYKSEGVREATDLDTLISKFSD